MISQPQLIPRVVVFDLGKVLVDFDYGIAAREIARRGKISAIQVQGLIDHAPLLFRFETGEIDRDEFFQEVAAATGFAGDFQEFAGLFAEIFTPIEPMVQFQTRLRSRQIPTFILSNTNDLAVGHIRRKFPFFSNFDGYVLSYEQGMMKPDSRIYEALERLAGAKGEEILFLDDRKENVSAALARGWQTIHHQNPGESITLIERMNLFGANS